MYPRIPVSSQSPKNNAYLYSFSQLETYHFRIPLDVTAKTEAPWNSRCAMVKNHPCSKAISSERKVINFAALHQRWWQSPYKWNILEFSEKHQQSIIWIFSYQQQEGDRDSIFLQLLFPSSWCRWRPHNPHPRPDRSWGQGHSSRGPWPRPGGTSCPSPPLL